MKKYLLLPILIFLSVSCGTSRVRMTEADPAAKKKFSQLKEKAEKNKKDQAIAGLTGFVKENPASTLTDDALILLGDLQYQKKDFQAAIQSYMNAASFKTVREPLARIGAARSYFQLQNHELTLETLQPVFEMNDLPPETLLNALKVKYAVFSTRPDKLATLKILVKLVETAPAVSEKESFRLRAFDIVETQLTPRELNTVADDSSFQFVRGAAYFRLGTNAFELSQFSEAQSYLKDAKKYLTDNQTIERVQDLLNQIESRQDVDSSVIGAVLPLTGRLSKIGYKTLRGLQLGLGIYGNSKSRIRLSIVDSEGGAELARNAVKRLVVEDHALALVGGVQSKTALVEATKAQEFGVPFICLSQKSGLTDVGPYVFRNSITSEMQVRRLVQSAMEDRGMTKFAIMYPNDLYGIEYANLFWDEVLARGGTIVAAQMYDPKETDFRGPIKRLVGTFYPEDRAVEYRLRLKEWQQDNAEKPGATKEPPEDLLPPIIDFDALFIPDAVKAIGQIAPMLAYNDIKDIPLLGTNLWNTPEFVARGEKFVEGSLFVDSWSPKEVWQQTPFFKEFVATYGYEPDIFELQGYEAGSILKTLIKNGVSSRDSLQERLTKLQAFPAPTGMLDMSPTREILRPISVLTVSRGTISPASGTH